jgi:hypothetical protein
MRDTNDWLKRGALEFTAPQCHPQALKEFTARLLKTHDSFFIHVFKTK